MACPRDYRIFEQPKILLREAGKDIIATYDDEKYYIMSSLYNIILKDKTYSLKYCLGLLNSSLFQYLMNLLTFDKTKGAFTKAKIFHYYGLPIFKANKKLQVVFEKVIDSILSSSNAKIRLDLELCLNLMVFKLYSLTYDECKIVDPEIEKLISREDYEKMSIEELAEYGIKN